MSVWRSPCAICGKVFNGEIYTEFTGEKWISKFLRKFSLEFSQKSDTFVGENYYLRQFPRVYIFFEKIIAEKPHQVRNLLYICAFIVDQLASVTTKKETTGVCSLSTRSHHRNALKYNGNNSLRTHIVRRTAPDRRSTVPSVSLSRHSAGYVHGRLK